MFASLTNLDRKLILGIAALLSVSGLLLAPIAINAQHAPGHDVQVGTEITMKSITGVAIIRGEDRKPTLKPVSIEFKAKVTELTSDGYRFNFTGGTINLDGKVYTVVRGRGAVLLSGDLTFVQGNVAGTGSDGGRFRYGCSGPLTNYQGKTIGGMDGIFQTARDQKFKIDWLAESEIKK